MLSLNFIYTLCDLGLYGSCLIIILGCLFISFRTRFVQIRLLPQLFRMIRGVITQKQEGSHTISPFKALFTAMSTTVGIATIVGPIIAINLGGPGALLGFLFASIFGSAATYVEVDLSIRSRKVLPSGEIMGGAMQYIRQLISPFMAKWYAFFGFILMMTWSSAQANQVAAILNSPLMGPFQITAAITGCCMAVLVLFFLAGGIQKIGALEAKLIPVKLIVYVGGSLFILLCNLPKLGEVFSLIFKSAFSPYAMASGTVVGGIMNTLRWGIFKGFQISEAGVGTQSIPHSMAETRNAEEQATLAMVSTYASGLIAFLSGCVVLVTDTWQNPALPMGISMMAASFQLYFSTFGIALIAFCALIFSFGTILGNSYNGSQILGYLTGNKKLSLYYLATALLIFLGAILDAKLVWAFTDVILALIAIPHMAALMLYVVKRPELAKNVSEAPSKG